MKVVFIFIFLGLAPALALLGTAMRSRRMAISGGRNLGMCDADMPDVDIQNLMNNGNVPKAPEREEDIQEESWEGFLKMEYDKIVAGAGSDPEVDGKLRLGFTEFYAWRNKMVSRREVHCGTNSGLILE